MSNPNDARYADDGRNLAPSTIDAGQDAAADDGIATDPEVIVQARESVPARVWLFHGEAGRFAAGV